MCKNLFHYFRLIKNLNSLCLAIIVCISSSVCAQELVVRKIGIVNGLPSNFTYDVAQAPDGAILFATDQGLYRYNGITASSIVENIFFIKVKTYNNSYFALTIDGTIYEFKQNKLLHKHTLAIQNCEDFIIIKSNIFISQGAQIIAFENWKNKQIISPKKDHINYLFSVNDKLNFGTNTGIYQWQNNQISETNKDIIIGLNHDSDNTHTILTTTYAKENYAKENTTLKNTFNLSNAIQLEKGLWFGTNGKKCVLVNNGKEFQIENNLLNNLNPNCIFKDRFGSIWITEKGKEVMYLPFPSVLRLRTTNNSEDGIRTDKMYSYIMSEQDYAKIKNQIGDIIDYYISEKSTSIATEKGLFQLLKNGKLIQLSTQIGHKIVVNDDETEFFFATDSEGIFIIDKNGKLVRQLAISDGLSHHKILDMNWVGNQLYVATESGGIDIIENYQVKDHPYNSELKKAQFLDLCSDSESKTVYLASPNLGIYYQRKSAGSWHFIPFNHLIYSIFIRNGVLWIAHDQGIDVLENGKIKQLYKPDDISDYFPFSKAVYQNEHKIVLGLHQGQLQFFEPKTNFKESNFQLLNVKINDKFKTGNNFNLSYGKYRIAFDIDKIDLKYGQFQRIEFRVIGYDSRWKRIEGKTIELVDLRDGEYRFEFRNGETGEEYAKNIQLTINKPFWSSWIFWLTIFLAGSAITYFIIKKRTKILRLENIKLEKTISKRTRELKEKNDDLEQYAFSVSHDFKNPVVNIEQLSGMLQSKDLPKEMVEEAINHINITAKSLHQNLLGMLDLLQVSGKSPKTDLIDFNELLKTVETNLITQFEATNAKLIIKNLDTKIFSNQTYLYSIFYNLISNSLKYHSEKTPLIEVTGTYIDGKLIILLKDNGKGLDSDVQLEKLFQPFVRIHTNGEGTGIGLTLISKMARALDIKISPKRNQAESGLTFELSFS